MSRSWLTEGDIEPDDTWEQVAQRWQSIALTWRSDLVTAQRHMEILWQVLTPEQQAMASARILADTRQRSDVTGPHDFVRPPHRA